MPSEQREIHVLLSRNKLKLHVRQKSAFCLQVRHKLEHFIQVWFELKPKYPS
jgi:hypothetical protein